MIAIDQLARHLTTGAKIDVTTPKRFACPITRTRDRGPRTRDLVLLTLRPRAVHQLDIVDRRFSGRLPTRQPDAVLKSLNKRLLAGLELVGEPVADTHARAATNTALGRR